MYYCDGESKSIDSQELISLIKQTLESDGEFKLLVTGNSMLPFMKHMRDSVILTHPSKRKLKRGEIVFVERESKKIVLHRVIQLRPNGFIMKGDSQIWVEFVQFDQIIAVVSKIIRKGKVISCDNLLYRFLSALWMLLQSILGLFVRGAGLLKMIYKAVMSGGQDNNLQ